MTTLREFSKYTEQIGISKSNDDMDTTAPTSQAPVASSSTYCGAEEYKEEQKLLREQSKTLTTEESSVGLEDIPQEDILASDGSHASVDTNAADNMLDAEENLGSSQGTLVAGSEMLISATSLDNLGELSTIVPPVDAVATTEVVPVVAQHVEITTESQVQAESAPAQISAPEKAFLPALPATESAGSSQETPQQDLNPSQ